MNPPDPRDCAWAVCRAVNCVPVSDRLRDTVKRALAWHDTLTYVEAGTTTAERAERLEARLKGMEGRAAMRAEAAAMREALGQAALRLAAGTEEEEAPAGPRPFDLGIMGATTFARTRFNREWGIKGVFVLNQPTIVGGPKKGMKTSVMIEFIISLATALRFLGEFEVPRARKVLFISGESGGPTIQETMLRICLAKGIDPESLEGNLFWGFTLPQINDPEHVEALAGFIRENGIEVVVIDPLYLCLTGSGIKVDPANLFEVGPILKRLSDACLDAGATPVIVHHLRKNRENPNAPPELEDLAFAGVQEFARQWILLGRREEYEPGSGDHRLWLVVGGSAGHSGGWAVNIAEGVIDEDFGGREWQVSIAHASKARAEAKQQLQATKAERAAEQAREKEAARAQRLRDDASTALGVLRLLGKASKRQWRAHPGVNCSNDKINSIIGLLEAENRIRPSLVSVPSGKGTKPDSGYEPAPETDAGTNRDEPGQGIDIGPSPGMGPGVAIPGRDGCVFKDTRPSTGMEPGPEAEPDTPKANGRRTHKRPGSGNPEGARP